MLTHAIFDEENELVRYVDKNTTGAVLMKQKGMFESVIDKEETYTGKIEAPIYEPKNVKPNLLLLCDSSKAKKLKLDIEKSSLSNDEKQFLNNAADRLNVFNYELIADYYAHSNNEMQVLMEQMALIIIDFDKAIELGYVQLSQDIKKQYLEYYD